MPTNTLRSAESVLKCIVLGARYDSKVACAVDVLSLDTEYGVVDALLASGWAEVRYDESTNAETLSLTPAGFAMGCHLLG